MKTVIFAGGFGTRLSEYTTKIPKPMVEIGGIPIIVHIMEHYSKFGHNEFIIALGYKSEYIKRYFLNFNYINSDLKISTNKNEVTILGQNKRNWEITLLDTGVETSTGSRLKKIKTYLNSERFFLTYGDGVSSVDISELLELHLKNKKICTMTCVRPTTKFGEVILSSSKVVAFEEKPSLVKGWINGGFMVCETNIFDFIPENDCMFEREPMQKLLKSDQLAAFKHEGFWKCMDSKKDKDDLESIWKLNNEWPV